MLIAHDQSMLFIVQCPLFKRERKKCSQQLSSNRGRLWFLRQNRRWYSHGAFGCDPNSNSTEIFPGGQHANNQNIINSVILIHLCLASSRMELSMTWLFSTIFVAASSFFVGRNVSCLFEFFKSASNSRFLFKQNCLLFFKGKMNGFHWNPLKLRFLNALFSHSTEYSNFILSVSQFNVTV